VTNSIINRSIIRINDYQVYKIPYFSCLYLSTTKNLYLGMRIRMGKETNMHRCRHCDQPYSTGMVRCDFCGSLLDSQLPQQQGHQTGADITTLATTPVETVSFHGEDISTNDAETAFPLSSVLVATNTPIPSSSSSEGSHTDIVEQMLRMLNDAALRVAAFERSPKRHLRPSRLSRYRDISGEIQRQNTPLPPLNKTTDDLNKQLVAIWPWLEDEEEPENATENQPADPLVRRSAPLSTLPTEQKHSERVTGPMPLSLSGRRGRFTLARLIVFSLILLAVLGFIIDGALAAVALSRYHSATIAAPIVNSPPALALSENKVRSGQLVHLHILHFSAASSILLTRDTGISVKTNAGNGFIHLNRTGSSDVTFSIGKSWRPGFHTLEAEDVITHYTASTTLQVVSDLNSPSPLSVSSTSLDFGADMQGTNTIQILTLYNSGTGPISWSAYSNQPWLRIAPTRGTYSVSQSMVIGVQRSNLPPRNYSATITISTSTGDSQQVQVTMAVQSLNSGRGAVLSVTPAVMALTTHADATSSYTQYLTVSNPGSQNLYWSLVNNLPVAAAYQGPVPQANWLSLDQTSGVLAPGMTSLVGAHTYSQNLLPGTYISDLLFAVSPGHTIQDTSQHVAVALTVQP
jgi:hypothetical protein